MGASRRYTKASSVLSISYVTPARNAHKIPEGSWFPLLVRALVSLRPSWRRGREVALARRGAEHFAPDLIDWHDFTEEYGGFPLEKARFKRPPPPTSAERSHALFGH
jgi:hypothetical protein